ncbi:14626_t:CDS:2, partial [Rhizophagus irregularis]
MDDNRNINICMREMKYVSCEQDIDIGIRYRNSITIQLQISMAIRKLPEGRYSGGTLKRSVTSGNACIFLIVSCYPKLISLRLTTKMGICSLLSQISITHELLGITYWSNNIPPFILDRVDLQLKRLIDLR